MSCATIGKNNHSLYIGTLKTRHTNQKEVTFDLVTVALSRKAILCGRIWDEQTGVSNDSKRMVMEYSEIKNDKRNMIGRAKCLGLVSRMRYDSSHSSLRSAKSFQICFRAHKQVEAVILQRSGK